MLMNKLICKCKQYGWVYEVFSVFHTSYDAIFFSFASGLTYYYLTNIATYGQMNIFKRFVDESKIKEEIEFNRKKYKFQKVKFSNKT